MALHDAPPLPSQDSAGALLRAVLARVAAGDPPEVAYAALAPHTRRRRLGQFFTPEALASLMVAWAVRPGAATVLDPGAGAGVFVRAALRGRGEGPPLRVTTYETDPVLAALLRSTVPDPRRVRVVEEDFITAPVPGRYDAVVANPPYIRHHDLAYGEDVLAWFDARCGLRVSRQTNLYGLFLLKAHLLLAPGGRAAVLTPSEFLNADFGVALKTYLLRTGHLDTLVVFSNLEQVFQGALTTACVTLLDTTREPDAPVRVLHVHDAGAIPALLSVLRAPLEPVSGPGWQQVILPRQGLDPRAKWTSLGLTAPPRSSRRLVPLREVARVMRGIATGANGFFTLDVARAAQAGIEPQHLRPCITRAAHAPYSDFTAADLAALERDGRRCLLLHYTGGPVPPGLAAYLAQGVAHGIHTAYLTRHRRPWFATEQRPPAPIWAGVFGRRDLRFVLNRAGVLNLTAFHCVYPHTNDSEVWRAFMAFLVTPRCREVLRGHYRVYGDGLLKVEPKDLAAMPVLDVGRLPGAQVRGLAALFDEVCLAQRRGEAAEATLAYARLAQAVDDCL